MREREERHTERKEGGKFGREESYTKMERDKY